MLVTVLYYIENHRDRNVTILGVFTDENPGSGKINAAIDEHMALQSAMGIRGVSRDDYRMVAGRTDETWRWNFS